MVKPPKTMQPEYRAEATKGRSKRAYSSNDSFHDYMARKIELQRRQMSSGNDTTSSATRATISGLRLPPPPTTTTSTTPGQWTPNDSYHASSSTSSSPLVVRPLLGPPSRKRPRGSREESSDNPGQYTSATTTMTTDETTTSSLLPSSQSKSDSTAISSVSSILQRLVQKHGSGKLRVRIRNKKKTERLHLRQGEDSPTHNMEGEEPVDTATSIDDLNNDTHPPKTTSKGVENEEDDEEDDDRRQQQEQQERRPDLFFLGIVIKVNGYTDPDSESLKRLIQKYGGDYELYETSRVTHIVAETLSKAKVDYYTSASSKQPRLKRPIVQPRWIVDSIQSQRLLPWTDYTCSVIRNQLQKPNQPGIRDLFQTHHDQSKAIVSTTLAEPSVHSTPQSSSSSLMFSTQYKPDHDQSKTIVPTTLTDIHGLQTEPLVHSIPQSSSSFLLLSTQQPLTETPTSTTHVIVVDDGMDNGAKDFGENSPPDPDSKCSPSLLLMKNHAEETSPTVMTVSTVATTRDEEPTTNSSPSTSKQQGHTDSKYIQGRIRTTGTDPNFLDSFFANSRLSFIGSYQQRKTTAAAPPFAASDSTTIASVQQIVPVSGDNSSNNIQRFVFHVDMDCFFANVVLRKYPQYRDQPVVISHHGKTLNDRDEDPKSSSMMSSSSSSTSECATCNYHARTFGIQKGMFLGRARQLCPDLIVLPYDFDGYEEVSEQVMSILHRVAAEFDGCVEAVSCDEAYVQVSLSPMNMVSSTDKATATILPEDFAGRIAESIRQEIFETTQCTASIGVASNKFLAKIGTDRVKPNGTYVVKDYRTLLESLRLRDLHGIGYRSEPKLAAQGLNTVQDVWDLGFNAESVLSQILGPGLGKKIFRYCQGKDDREVKAAERKTIGAECNYGVRFDGPYGIDHFMNRLAAEVSKRMENVGYKGTKLTLKMKQRKVGAKPPPKFLGHGSCHNLSRSMDLPGCTPTRSAEILAAAGMTLFRELDVPLDDVRGMGMVVSKLSPDTTTTAKTAPASGIASYFQTSVEPKSPRNMTHDDGEENSPRRDSEQLFLHPKSKNNSSIPYLDDEDHITEGTSRRDVLDHIDFMASSVAAAPPLSQGNLALPPLSQICMSQVEALPQEMQDEIRSRLTHHDQQQQDRHHLRGGSNLMGLDPVLVDLTRDQEIALGYRGDGAAKDIKSYQPMIPLEKQSYRQIDLKCMMKLAAIKSGEVGGGMSLEDFQALPLELQLQIANGDHHPLGLLSPKHPPRPNRSNTKKVDRVTPVRNVENRLEGFQPEDISQQAMEHEPPVDSVPMPQKDLFDDDIVPLRHFLNDNSPTNPEAIEMVHTFLRTCLLEHRMNALRPLLQSIRNRNDDLWSQEDVLMKIGQLLDDTHFEVYGKRLDLDWLIQGR